MPVKRLEIAKTRLGLDPEGRAELALAMAMDTALACGQTPQVAVVVVVSDDARAAAALASAGAVVVADEPDAGLNPALVHGAEAAARIEPDAGVATVASDLPCLRTAELAAVLGLATNHASAAVADASGVGTTLLATRAGTVFKPEFGAESFARHIAAGAADLTARAGASLRRDVDTMEDLRAALELGCGPHTAAVAVRMGLVPGPAA
jgi:2-phospho-L-lactate guanylyltransferase